MITLICLLFPLLNSCFGLNMDITLNKNGSGILSLEYRISKLLDSLGKLEGNERWNTIPAGKADFERTLSRLPGLKMLSFSSREDQKDVIISSKIEFGSIKALMAFVDASGGRSSLQGDPGSGSLRLTLSEGAADGNPALLQLIKEISTSYSVDLSMSLQSEGSLDIVDNSGIPLEQQKRGKKLSCSFPLYTVLSSQNGINAVFRW